MYMTYVDNTTQVYLRMIISMCYSQSRTLVVLLVCFTHTIDGLLCVCLSNFDYFLPSCSHMRHRPIFANKSHRLR